MIRKLVFRFAFVFCVNLSLFFLLLLLLLAVQLNFHRYGKDIRCQGSSDIYSNCDQLCILDVVLPCLVFSCNTPWIFSLLHEARCHLAQILIYLSCFCWSEIKSSSFLLECPSQDRLKRKPVLALCMLLQECFLWLCTLCLGSRGHLGSDQGSW